MKRAFDIAASGIGFFLALPLAAGAAFTMFAVLRSNPIFIQERVGKEGQTFRIFKIKTMRDSFNQAAQPTEAERTPLAGKIIRKLKIDELPQLLNILKGDMSIVGPRPLTPVYGLAHDRKRQSVKPGLTGPAQLAGMNVISEQTCLTLDHDYIDRSSLLWDLKIILTTPFAVLKQLNEPHYREQKPQF